MRLVDVVDGDPPSLAPLLETLLSQKVLLRVARHLFRVRVRVRGRVGVGVRIRVRVGVRVEVRVGVRLGLGLGLEPRQPRRRLGTRALHAALLGRGRGRG